LKDEMADLADLPRILPLRHGDTELLLKDFLRGAGFDDFARVS
jgi:hypothetical protein